MRELLVTEAALSQLSSWKPIQVKIADKMARSAITKRVDIAEYKMDPKIAYVKRRSHLCETYFPGNPGESFPYKIRKTPRMTKPVIE
ncbi:MAG: hypothetical protein ACLR2E_04810 [Lachnospiraceae bacterium]